MNNVYLLLIFKKNFICISFPFNLGSFIKFNIPKRLNFIKKFRKKFKTICPYLITPLSFSSFPNRYVAHIRNSFTNFFKTSKTSNEIIALNYSTKFNEDLNNLLSSFSQDLNLDEKSVLEKLPLVCCYSDLTSNERKLIRTNDNLWNLLYQPEFHSIYLNDHKLVLLDRNKDICWYEFWNLICPSGFDDNFNNQIDIISKGLARYDEKKMGFYSMVLSPFGNKYFKRDIFPKDFAQNIYNYCNEIKDPNFLYYSIYIYFNNEIIFLSEYAILDDLVGSARKDLASHNLGNFIFYREQALCIPPFF